MIGYTTPEKAGISASSIERFLKELKRRGLNMHSVLMLRGNDIFFEKYWAPFHKDMPHRMYSVTKSFVSIAIGCLSDEGKIDLDDPIISYFPDKLPENVPELLKTQTIRHMLMMSTSMYAINWFKEGVYDRTKFYFEQTPNRPAGTLFDYDSTGSYILGALVERVSGMSLLDYLKKKILNRLGGFENAHILKSPDGVSWGDSALLCTPRALMNFARFVMNKGVWEDERLLSKEYLDAATSCQTTNDLECKRAHNHFGYGYQIWMNEQNGFSFFGMGGQYAVCIPKKDFIFVCTGDNQYNEYASEILFRAIFDILIPDKKDVSIDSELPSAMGSKHSEFARSISGKIFPCEENEMKIKWFRLDFAGDEGVFAYENAQGKKTLPFGMAKNVFSQFPQLGYSDEYGNVHDETGFKYRCAASAGWIEEKKLQIRIQIIDRYFGSLVITFGFRNENTVSVRMIKNAEDFLNEYNGWMYSQIK
ncbi:MAG: serine hydrolase [Clostridia bacterium]|nr:serine hydrolase [Clostridia bacterium]